MNNIAVVTSRNLAKSGGIQTVTQTLFKEEYPIFFLEDTRYSEIQNFEKIIFSGFDASFIETARKLKKEDKKIAIFWHFGLASQVDKDIGDSWKAVLSLQKEHVFDLFITCKYGLAPVIEKIFRIPTFFILNNAIEDKFKLLPKEGIGIYSGSSDYWVKNIRSNLYAALMTGKHVDVLPYEDSIKSVVKDLNMMKMVTGTKERLAHSDFLKRMASRELVTYVTFAEGAPILPLEALNNGVICITGDNHHYFQSDQRLHDLLVCTRPDDPEAIFETIQNALESKNEILFRYTIWKAEYDQEQKKNFAKFRKVIQRL